ncbi:glycosyltransferase family 2 protein [Cohnella cholangitidis]|nr:glycosyltransferase family 2 protein [Cohnella cholangitidis]
MSSPVITIITAVFNGEQTIESTLKSVARQTYPNIEYIIVDGGSTDRTMEIVERYESSIAKMISEKDSGVYDAFNKGVRAATGDFVYFLNADDYLYNETTIERIAATINESPEINAIYGNILRVEPVFGIEQVYGREFNANDFIQGYMPPHQALFVKREMFNRYGHFDLNYRSSSDFDFISKLYLNEKERMIYIDETIAVFRLGGLSTHYKTRIIGMRETEQLIFKHFDRNVDLSATEIRNNALFRHWLESILQENKGITAGLKDRKIQRIAIFGTMNTAHYLLKDAKIEGIEVKAFIDNNKYMHDKEINGIRVVPTDWLSDNHSSIDAVIVSLESNNDQFVIKDLENKYGKHLIVLSWKQLI